MGAGFGDRRRFSAALISAGLPGFSFPKSLELERHFNSNTAFTCAVTVAFCGLNSSVGAAS
jgi:hypothetical protein